MYIFSRSVRLAAGDPRQQMAWTMAITEKVNQISEVPVNLWNMFASRRADVVAWSARVPNLSVLEAIDDKLMADDSYLSLVAAGAKHVSGEGLTDQLVQLIHADEDVDANSLRYVQIGSAIAAPGQMRRVGEVGVELTKRAQAVTGLPSSFGAVMTGPPGTFQWASYFTSIEQLEQAQAKLWADQGFLDLVDGDASRIFAASGDQVIVRRVM